MFSDGPVRFLADGIHVQAEEHIAHRRVCRDRHFANAVDRNAKSLDRVRQVAKQRALQKASFVIRIVMDARHDVGSAEALRIFERLSGNEFTGGEIV